MAVKRKVETHDQPTGSPFLVSQSTIKTWRRCRRKYWYKFVELLERKRPVLQLIRGTMIGKCLDAIALARVSKKKPPHWAKVLDPFKKEYSRWFEEEREHYGDPIAEVHRIIARYETIYANDGLTYQLGKDGLPYELKVEVPLADGIVFQGHIDKMPIDKQGRVWDMDHKSHKNIPEPQDRFSDLQQLFYMWAMPLSGYPKPTGVIWDYLRTKPPAVPQQLKEGGLSQRKNIDTDYDTYLAEVKRLKLKEADYPILRELKKRGHFDFYQRVPLPGPNPDMVKQVVADAKESAFEMKHYGGISKVRSMDRTCTRCEFYNLCQAELRGLDASFIRKSEYQVQKDPRHVHQFSEEE